MKPKTIWIGFIPGIFGYGIGAAGTTKAEVRAGLKAGFDGWKQQAPAVTMTFSRAFEYWGGYIHKIDLGKPYNDNFT